MSQQDSDKQTGMVDDFEDFFKGKKNTCEAKTSPTFPVFLSEHAMLTASRREFSDLHSIFRLCALRY